MSAFKSYTNENYKLFPVYFAELSVFCLPGQDEKLSVVRCILSQTPDDSTLETRNIHKWRKYYLFVRGMWWWGRQPWRFSATWGSVCCPGKVKDRRNKGKDVNTEFRYEVSSGGWGTSMDINSNDMTKIQQILQVKTEVKIDKANS